MLQAYVAGATGNTIETRKLVGEALERDPEDVDLRLEYADLLARADARTAIHGDRINEGRHLGVDSDDLIGLQFSRQAHRDGQLASGDLDHFNGGSRSPLAIRIGRRRARG